MKPWMHPWAGLYVVQIAIGTVVWMVLDPRGGGVLRGLAGGAIISLLALALALWRSRPLFQKNVPSA